MHKINTSLTLINMSFTPYDGFAIFIAYLIGSLSFAVLVSRAFGLSDPRSYGSGNPGATNVLRSGSKFAAIITLVLDVLKGFIPVWIAQLFGPILGLSTNTVALVALSAFLGHLYPLFFSFKGGKGVSTALGVLIGINAWLGLAVLLTWLIVAVLFRYSSLAAMISSLLAPLYFLLGSGVFWPLNGAVFASISIISLFLLWRHAQNLDRLLHGLETKIGATKKPTNTT
jgi:glycerol-3-phosphate acyltransferase PlsY